MTPETHIMVDIETLGDLILSIGAVRFTSNDPEESLFALDNQFHVHIRPETCEAVGLKPDAATVLWWMQQSQEARDAVCHPPSRTPLAVALDDFRWFCDLTGELAASRLGQGTAPAVMIWCKGAGYDFPKLQAAYKAIHSKLPWHFRHERCYRTLKANFPCTPEPKRAGTHHDALDDAIHQARHLRHILKKLHPTE